MQAQKEREEALAAKAKAEEEPSNPNFDNEAEGGEWVTQENLYSYISHGDAEVLNLIKEDPKPEMPIMDDDDCPPLEDLTESDNKASE